MARTRKPRRRPARSTVRLTGPRTQLEADRVVVELESQCELLHEKLDALEAQIPEWLASDLPATPSSAPRKPR